jgi:cob(I)alamin adenosyltransferase
MIQIYTGEGKGKTTAAFGLALRAIGAGKKVAFIQFMKKPDTSEYKAIKKYKLPIDINCYGIGFYKILGDTHSDTEHKKSCQNALEKTSEVILSNKYDLIILDEINVAIDLGLVDVNDVFNMLNKEKLPEIVLTGRNADNKLIGLADLVSVIKAKKHYFNKDVKARKGIEY